MRWTATPGGCGGSAPGGVARNFARAPNRHESRQPDEPIHVDIENLGRVDGTAPAGVAVSGPRPQPLVEAVGHDRPAEAELSTSGP